MQNNPSQVPRQADHLPRQASGSNANILNKGALSYALLDADSLRVVAQIVEPKLK
eukprot:COSAG06_NODE_3185_length_5718_cov_5.232960_2_plen_55_part_00